MRGWRKAERFAALGRLAASVGHEINNPLAYVSMNVDLAVTQLEQFVERADRSAASADLANLPSLFRECRVGLDRIRDVVKDLQKLSRQAEVRRETFSLNDLLDESLAMARNQVEHRARVRKLYGEVHAVVGDRSALGQVLLNLILNAAQALPEGQAESNEITLKTYMRGANVDLEVADTGALVTPRFRTSSTLSSPPSRSARGRGWGWPSLAGSSPITEAESTSRASSAGGRCFGSLSRSPSHPPEKRPATGSERASDRSLGPESW